VIVSSLKERGGAVKNTGEDKRVILNLKQKTVQDQRTEPRPRKRQDRVEKVKDEF